MFIYSAIKSYYNIVINPILVQYCKKSKKKINGENH